MDKSGRRVRVHLDGQLVTVELAGNAVRSFALEVGLDALAAGDLELATVEAANNIIEHGFNGATPPYFMTIALRGGEIQVVLFDSGQPIPQTALDETREWNTDPDASRGLAIIRACTDRFEYSTRRSRNRLLLAKRLPL